MKVKSLAYRKCSCGMGGCSAYIMEGQGSAGFDLEQAQLMAEAPVMRDLLLRLNEAIQALDGTSVENEKIVDDYNALMFRLL